MLNSLVDLVNRLVSVYDDDIPRFIINHVERMVVVMVDRCRGVVIEPSLMQIVKISEVVEVYTVDFFVSTPRVQTFEARLWFCPQVEDEVEITIVV